MTVPVAAAAAEGAGAAGAAESSGAGTASASGGGGSGVVSMVKKAPGNPLNHHPYKKKKPTADKQRADIQAIKDRREPEPEPEPEPGETSGDGTSAAAPLFRMPPMEPVSSGAGVVLGALAWIVAVNYLHGGVPQVRKLLAAKFLNKTGA